MSNSYHKTKIQKEILDSVLNLYKKREEDVARNEKENEDANGKKSYVEEAQQDSEDRYVPSTGFYKIFSQIVGEQKLECAQRDVHQSNEKETEQVTHNLNNKTGFSQELKKTENYDEKIEKTNSTIKTSVFEVLSHRTKKEDPS